MADVEREKGEQMTKFKFVGPVYRHTHQENFAQDFVAGKFIYVSTLEACRAYEDAEQGDAGEATSFYSHKPIHGSHPNFKEIAERLGVIGDGDIELMDNFAYKKLPDAYVLCFSFKKFDDSLQHKFGEYCVTVKNLHELSVRLVRAMALKVPVRRALFGPVEYRSREYSDTQPEPAAPFVKPVVPYACQREVRLIVTCESGHVYKPFGVEVPICSGLLSYERLPKKCSSTQHESELKTVFVSSESMIDETLNRIRSEMAKIRVKVNTRSISANCYEPRVDDKSTTGIPLHKDGPAIRSLIEAGLIEKKTLAEIRNNLLGLGVSAPLIDKVISDVKNAN